MVQFAFSNLVRYKLSFGVFSFNSVNAPRAPRICANVILFASAADMKSVSLIVSSLSFMFPNHAALALSISFLSCWYAAFGDASIANFLSSGDIILISSGE